MKPSFTDRTPLSPLRGAGGSTATTPIDKAEVLADSLQKQFQLNRDIENRPLTHTIQKEVSEFLRKPHANDLEPISAKEVADFINKLKPNKALGLNLNSNRMLKNLPFKFILYITLILNLMLERCYFPQCWKTAVVIPIPKPEQNMELPQNYRPISLLSSLTKVYESVFFKRLNQFLDKNHIIISEQFGFKKIFPPATSCCVLRN
ncbi:RNA-directed DNA polymerase from mobile element jockey [Araneus ventricosus]|uniref:RNA-directed DNA polymerase from mobile element jockey n=1 Tax=Araneus ventricosus TaxID=182803 RepID=A0A4Y2IGY9_ARAVE|nr:RNA-directed DNA polymerase from mobile element jockey [Araneus ventricosus]